MSDRIATIKRMLEDGAGTELVREALRVYLRHLQAQEEAGQEEQVVQNDKPYTKCPKCGKFMSSSGVCAHCDFIEDDRRMIARGRIALKKATEGNPRDVESAMYRKGVGSIDFVQGWRGKGAGQEHGSGLIKMQQKHRWELDRMPETIVKGEITKLPLKGTLAEDKNGLAIVHGSNIAIISRKEKGKGWRLITHYSSERDARKMRETAKRIEVSQ